MTSCTTRRRRPVETAHDRSEGDPQRAGRLVVGQTGEIYARSTSRNATEGVPYSSGSLYGQPLELEFLSRLRSIQPFESVQALKAQLTRDVAAAQKIESERPEPEEDV